ncbi:MAG: UDP-N-acetylmuramoyl-L-alanine--D-glutamate ligase [Robiginitomaculum sp.]|nr:MAG: UDP-N-acetylmuramoyl-L-alanine--D-glutamate ligase [Robiginitomaculum sp.]
MIQIDEFSGRNIAILGLGRTGLAAAKSLIAGGAGVLAWDDGEAQRAEAEAAGISIVDLCRRDLSDLAALVLSPGIPPFDLPEPHHAVTLARACDVPIINDVELFGRAMNALPAEDRPKLVGITGTNGKSTTTALVTHILQSAHLNAICGGNIGRACLDLPALSRGQVIVLELSSYQLEIADHLRCDVALLLNLSPDHLDRHGDMAGYQQAKVRIFKNQQQGDMAIVGVDDTEGDAILADLEEGPQSLCAVSASRALSHGIYVLGGKLVDASGDAPVEIADLSQAPGLRGQHNWQNAAAAYAIARHLAVSPERIAEGLYSFKGLAHRMELLGQMGNILFVNDSKATNGAAAARAVSSYSNVYWIGGGLAKEDGLDAILPHAGNIRKAFLIGKAAPDFGTALKGHCPTQQCKTLERAFVAALKAAAVGGDPEAVILLSPACASFDQFDSFEARGEAFAILVEAALSAFVKPAPGMSS